MSCVECERLPKRMSRRVNQLPPSSFEREEAPPLLPVVHRGSGAGETRQGSEREGTPLPIYFSDLTQKPSGGWIFKEVSTSFRREFLYIFELRETGVETLVVFFPRPLFQDKIVR